MATSTTTVWTSQILTEALRPLAFAAHTPKSVIVGHVNSDSLDGLPTLKKQYAVDADIGAAGTASEGSDISSSTTLSKGTAVTLTPTENAAIRVDITERALRRKMPGLPSGAVDRLIASGDVVSFASMIGSEAGRMVAAGDEKLEDDLANLLGSASNTVGTSGTDIAFSDCISAIYTLKTLEPMHEDLVFIFTPNQVRELQTSVLGTAADVLTQQGDLSFFNFRPDMSRNGFRGTLLGIPVYEYSHSLRTTANSAADVVGALMCRGVGAPDTPGGQLGALGVVEGAPPRWSMEYDASLRTVELFYIHEYAVGILDDDNIVGIVTDAP